MATLFISDLHLDSERPEIGSQFLDFLGGEAREAEALYILGDLFDSWVGDDDPNPHFADMKRAITAFTASGVPAYFMHGNRDFMIGSEFADETGVHLLPDPTMVDLYGSKVLLAHGDALCTDDIEYQQVRAMVRNPDWQRMILGKPLAERLALAADVRAKSQLRNAGLPEAIMDVNQAAVEQLMSEHAVTLLLHGHTHRPAVHDFKLGDKDAQRIVLGDWFDHGSVVRWNANGYSLDTMAR
ncbi:MAG TPA: UDP-2,3-diacylglucosamine diphosphatase [Woeseiaceae bacterium]|nr:UDP-2,3-diacylglucosamine diphosphatase [Woeseiaceae bacterium]